MTQPYERDATCSTIRTYCLAVCAALATATGHAQDKELSERDFLEELPVVLSVSRMPQRLNETPGAVTVIDAETIRRSGAREVADVLRLVPGFQVAYARSGEPVAVYHGTWRATASRIQVLIDGRSVYSTHNIGSALQGLRTIALDDIDRIEVLRGSNSASYGARAFLGVINVITKDPLATQGTSVSATRGQDDIADGTVRHGWSSERAAYRLTLDTRGDRGFSELDRNRLHSANFRGDVQIDARSELQMRAGLSRHTMGDNLGAQAGNTPHPRTFDKGYVQLDWRRTYGPDEELHVHFAHDEERYGEKLFQPLDAPFNGLWFDWDGRGRIDTVSANYRFSLRPGLRASSGVELRREQDYSPTQFATPGWLAVNFARLYTNFEWRAHDKLVVNASAMHEHSNASGSALLPRVMLNWLATPTHTFRAGVSTASRPPSMLEQRYNMPLYALNGDYIAQNWLQRSFPKRETLVAREIGYLGDFRDARALVDVRVFEERLKHFVEFRVYTMTPPAPVPLLTDQTLEFFSGRELTTRGAEYQVKWQPWLDTQLLVTQTYTRPDYDIHQELLSMPRLATAGSWMQQLSAGYEFTLSHFRASSMSWQGAGSALAPWHRTDARIGRRFRIGATRAQAGFVVQNVGQAYNEYLPQYLFNRRAFLTLKLEQ